MPTRTSSATSRAATARRTCGLTTASKDAMTYVAVISQTKRKPQAGTCRLLTVLKGAWTSRRVTVQSVPRKEDCNEYIAEQNHWSEQPPRLAVRESRTSATRSGGRKSRALPRRGGCRSVLSFGGHTITTSTNTYMSIFKTLTCPHCGANLNNSMDATVRPRCNKDFNAPVEPEEPREALVGPFQEVPRTTAQSPLGFLQQVRSRSCYVALRGMTDAFTVLNVIAVLVPAGFLVVSGSGSSNTLLVIIGLAVGAFGCFLTVASRQASLLLVDIADVLIEQNRDKT